MTFTISQKKEAYKKLSPEVQNFIMDNETTELIGTYLKNVGLVGEQGDSADTEILNSMFGLQTLQDAIVNIAKLNNKNINDFSKLKSDLENNIFSKIPVSKTVDLNKVDWQGRVDEISKKYNLNDAQKNTLNSICKEVLSSMNKKGELLSNLDQKLGVSKLLSEQIIDDLNKRVFEYTLKVAEPKPITKPENKIETTSQKNVFKTSPVIPPAPVATQQQKPISKIPEIKPVNLPIETTQPIQKTNPTFVSNSPINIPKYVPTGTSSYKPTGLGEGVENKPRENVQVGDSRIKYTPTPVSSSSATNEPVQKPKEVPRFNATLDDNKPQTPVPPSPSSIVDSKLNTVTTGIKEPKQEEVKTENPIVKKYTVDPYREPLA